MILKKLTFPLCLLAVTHLVNAQVSSSVTTAVEKNRILLGEPLLMVIEAKFPEKKGTRFSMPDTIAHFEFLEEPAIDSVSENGIATLKGRYKITSFDSGHWVIPSFQIPGSVKSDSIGIDVVFSEFNPEQEYHDIKDIIEVKPEKKQTWWWYAAGGALLLGLLLVYWLRKKKPVPVAQPATVTDPYEEAMQQLLQLQKNKPDAKQYYTKLADTFRLYIFRRKGILSLQKTTDDLILQLKSLRIGKEQFDKLSQSLRLGDFVKFAKYNPAEEDDVNSLKEIRNSITEIEKTEAKTSGQENQ